jgi:hypothetical protein
VIAASDDDVARLRRQVEQKEQTIAVLRRSFFALNAAIHAADTSDALRRVAREHRERVCVALGIPAQPTCPRCGHRPCSC